MSRIRTTKPEYWSSEQIMNLTVPARLLFIGMWNFCDDAGNHPSGIKTLKAEVLPGDEIDVTPLVQEMIDQGLLVEYEVEGKRYWHITGWHHQKIDKPNYKHPLPNGVTPKVGERYESIRVYFADLSRPFRESS